MISVVRRLSSRLMCQNKDCQAVYSHCLALGWHQSKIMFVIDVRVHLIQRADDKPEVIRDRLVVYHQHDPSDYF